MPRLTFPSLAFLSMLGALPQSASGQTHSSTTSVETSSRAETPVDAGANPARPPPAPPSAPPPPDIPEEDSLATLEHLFLEETDATFPNLQLYGFVDVTYMRFLMEDDNPWRSVIRRNEGFTVGNLNVYLDSQLSPHWKSLIETRFLFSPNGVTTLETDGTVARFDTAVSDPNDLSQRPDINWGGVEIERVWLQYQPRDELGVRFGLFLTPYGIWNVDHGSPTLIGINKPYAIGLNLFPERQTGIQAFGRTSGATWTLGYHLTLSNGRGPVHTLGDIDAQLALGGRVFFETNVLGQLVVGSSLFSGRYTDEAETWTANLETLTLDVSGTVIEAYDERSWAFDVRWSLGGLLFNSELVIHDVVFDDAARPPLQGRPGLQPDYQQRGAYALLAYQLPWWGLMPYTIGQWIDLGDSAPGVDRILGISLGLNANVAAAVTLKSVVFYAKAQGDRETSLTRAGLTGFQLQAAWAF